MPVDTSKTTIQAVGYYDLLEKIAEGGMGAIYKARHRETGQLVAIKIMPQHTANNQVLLKRFEQEFRAASRLNHPNIIRALDYGDTGSTPYLVMEFVDGESLGRKLERDGRLPEADAIRLIAQVAQGLHRAHKQGLIHRDVKPDNILLTSDGQAKLADLGLVKEIDADLNLTRTGRGLGTPHFMAPEQFRDAKNADVRCDIYSLGATLYMMVTGELPFRSTGPLDAWMKKIQNELVPPRKAEPSLSERVDWAIRRAMSANPEMRPATCREFVEDLTGRSTRRVTGSDTGAGSQDLWYLKYQDEEGQTHVVKGTISAIRRSLKEGLLGDASNIVAGRDKAGPFEPLRGHPEFRDLVVSPEPVSPSKFKSSAAAPVVQVPGPNVEDTKRMPTAAPTNPEAAPAPNAPHIELQPEGSRRSREWLKVVLLLIVALVTAIVGFFLFSHGR
jgi:serine/threonine protein kinase